MGPPDAPTYRHSALYITALEVVKTGDRNLESYNFMLDGLVDLRERGAEISAPNDGLGIAEQQVSNTGVAGGSNKKTKSRKAACSVRSVEGNHMTPGGATSVSVHPPASQGEGGQYPKTWHRKDLVQMQIAIIQTILKLHPGWLSMWAKVCLRRKGTRNVAGQQQAGTRLRMRRGATKDQGFVRFAGAKDTSQAPAPTVVTPLKREGKWVHAASVGCMGIGKLRAASHWCP